MAAEGEVIAVHSVAEWTEKLKAANESKKLIVIDFTARWCPPCRTFAPIFDELAKKNLDVVFIKVDVDEDDLNTVAEEFKVQAMPTIIFMKEGEVKDTVVGDKRGEIIAKIEKYKTVAAA
ncbi:unnamed protein product [Arabidopsis arenosa]|uniref:Thioredoxin domain-containing protein n=1 Tax=Arabidopsis arenosa TaxID=38785 RepID=A0A8S2B867_ARAAE|nr:unnamed protein product [Arabidopsis arenosa]